MFFERLKKQSLLKELWGITTDAAFLRGITTLTLTL